MTLQEKRDALIAEINKRYGRGTIGKGSDLPKVSFIRSGIPKLDWALNGGLARGRIVEFWGVFSGGKSTILGLYIAAEQKYQAQQPEPRRVALFDRENTFDADWYEKLGVDLDMLDVIRDGYPDAKGNPVYHTAEDVVNMTLTMMDSGLYSVIAWDSLPAMIPRAKLEGKKDFADQKAPAALAALLSETLPYLCAKAASAECTLVVINQLREKIGVLYGDTATRLGGHALDHYASQIVRVSKGDYFEADAIDPETGAAIDKIRVGNEIRVKCTKSKVGPPFREAVIPVFYDRGIDLPQMIADLSLDLRVVEQSGRWISHPVFEQYGKSKCGSREEYLQLLKAYPDLLGMIQQECEEVLTRV